MSAVNSPRFAGIDECGQNHSSVDPPLGGDGDPSTLADSGAESSKDRACFCKPTVDLVVNVDASGQGTSKVSELVHCLAETCTFGCDFGLSVLLSRCWLEDDLSLLGADGDTEVVTGR